MLECIATVGSTRFVTDRVEDYILKRNVILPKIEERCPQSAYTMLFTAVDDVNTSIT